MSAITKIRRMLGDAGHRQSSTADRLASLIAERDALKREIGAAKRLAAKHGVSADTLPDAIRMLKMRPDAPRRAPSKRSTLAPSPSSKPAKRSKRRPPVMRTKARWSRAAALKDIIEKTGLAKADLTPSHTETRWVWKVKP